MADQSTWPAHLRDDAPYQICNRCGRKTWTLSDFDGRCIMPQSYSANEGWYNPCRGLFVSPNTEGTRR